MTDWKLIGLMAYIVRGASAPDLTFTRTGGDVALGRIVAYRGNHATTPLDTGSANTLATASATATTGTITTAEAEELIVAFCSPGDNLTGSAFAATDPATASGATNTTTAPTNGTWIERADSGTVTGADGACIIADAVRATAGATGTIQATISASARHVMAVGAFRLAAVTEATQRSAGITALEATAAARGAAFSSLEATAAARGAALSSLEATAAARNALLAEMEKAAIERVATLASLEATVAARLALATELISASTEATQRAALAAALEAVGTARAAALASLEATAQARAALAGNLTFERAERAAATALLNAENIERTAACALLNATATERLAFAALLNVEATERAAATAVLETIATTRVGTTATMEAGASGRAALTAAFEDEVAARVSMLATLEVEARDRVAGLTILTIEAIRRVAVLASMDKNVIERVALTTEFELPGVPHLTTRGYAYDDWIFQTGSTTLNYGTVDRKRASLVVVAYRRKSDGVNCSREHVAGVGRRLEDFEPIYNENANNLASRTIVAPILILRQPLPSGATLYVESWNANRVIVVNTHPTPLRADLVVLFDDDD